MIRPPPRSPLFPYATLSRSVGDGVEWRHALPRRRGRRRYAPAELSAEVRERILRPLAPHGGEGAAHRSEEHTSELQSPCNLVCRPLLEKKTYILQISFLHPT